MKEAVCSQIELNQTLDHVHSHLLKHLDFLRENSLLTSDKQISLYKALGYSELLQDWFADDNNNSQQADDRLDQQRFNNALQVLDHLSGELCQLNDKVRYPIAISYQVPNRRLLAPSLWLDELRQALNHLEEQQNHFYKRR